MFGSGTIGNARNKFGWTRWYSDGLGLNLGRVGRILRILVGEGRFLTHGVSEDRRYK